MTAAAEVGSCAAVASVLARVGDRWSMLVVVLLGPGPRRFNELKRAVHGVSQRMLSLTLRRLERDGLVDRTVTPTVPPRVDYALTDLGQSLRLTVDGLARWAIVHRPAIAAAQQRFDAQGPRMPIAEAPHRPDATGESLAADASSTGVIDGGGEPQ